MADDKKTLKFQMMMAPSEAAELDDWMFKNRIRSRAEAIRRLTQIALTIEPLVEDLHRIWREVQAAEADIGSHLIDGKANLDMSKDELLKSVDSATDKLVPAALELGVHAAAMSEIFNGLKAGENVESSLEWVQARLRDREGVRDFIRRTWGHKAG